MLKKLQNNQPNAVVNENVAALVP